AQSNLRRWRRNHPLHPHGRADGGIRITLFPTLIGEGILIFGETEDEGDLELISVCSSSSGLVDLNYRQNMVKKASPPSRLPKAAQRLSNQMILQTALPIAQSKGADTLSFRILADQLDVTQMAVTYHAGSKKQLLSDLVELAVAGILDGVDGGTTANRTRGIIATY
ncbi:MAG: hypothetical protein ABJZ69_01665, partial [Hyphomicrobiales bacterium]